MKDYEYIEGFCFIFDVLFKYNLLTMNLLYPHKTLIPGQKASNETQTRAGSPSPYSTGFLSHPRPLHCQVQKPHSLTKKCFFKPWNPVTALTCPPAPKKQRWSWSWSLCSGQGAFLLSKRTVRGTVDNSAEGGRIQILMRAEAGDGGCPVK